MSLKKLDQLRNKKEGFTIIEVLIVLAIAGLILLIVFLAVPALQRNQRNSGRKSDAGHISTAINDYVSNNNGTLPQITNWATVCPSIMQDAGTLNSYTYGTASNDGIATCGSSGSLTVGQFNVSSTPGTTSTVTSTSINGFSDNDAILLVEQAQCSTDNGTTVATTAGSSNQAALVYTLESGSSTLNQACLNVE